MLYYIVVPFAVALWFASSEYVLSRFSEKFFNDSFAALICGGLTSFILFMVQ